MSFFFTSHEISFVSSQLPHSYAHNHSYINEGKSVILTITIENVLILKYTFLRFWTDFQKHSFWFHFLDYAQVLDERIIKNYENWNFHDFFLKKRAKEAFKLLHFFKYFSLRKEGKTSLSVVKEEGEEKNDFFFWKSIQQILGIVYLKIK